MRAEPPQLRWRDGDVYALCHDGALKLLQFELGDGISSAQGFHRRFGERSLPLRGTTEAAE